MLEGKATIKETDMPEKMQIQAMACASQALDLYDVVDCISIAAHIKKVLILLFIYFLRKAKICEFCMHLHIMFFTGSVLSGV
jgi:hypothetical protein